jgi:hypothetical protein
VDEGQLVRADDVDDERLRDERFDEPTGLKKWVFSKTCG